MINQTELKTSESRLLKEVCSKADLMLKLLIQGDTDIQNNRTKPQKQVFSKLRASLKARVNQK